MKIFCETERLILREILPTDSDGMYELDSDPDVHKYLGNTPVTTKEQVDAIIDFIRQQYLTYGIGRWAIIDKQSEAFSLVGIYRIAWSDDRYIPHARVYYFSVCMGAAAPQKSHDKIILEFHVSPGLWYRLT